MQPFFLTGANAKIKINNQTLAYCTNLSYSVKVNHATPRVLGMYEATSIEPLSYIVTGSFTVIRYIADVKGQTGTSPNGVNEGGNGVGNMGPDGLGKRLSAGFSLSGTDGRTYDNLNPGKLDKSTGFEIYVYQKLETSTNTEGDKIRGVQSVARIRDARITQADFSLSKNTAASQTFQFTAVYADEDSFKADASGRGEQFV